MNRTISLVAVGGLLTAAICLPLAAFLNRDGPKPGQWGSLTTDLFGDGPDRDGGPVVSRDFTWDGSDRVELDGSGDLHFRPAPAWHLSVRGTEQALGRLRVENGHIATRNSGFFHWGNPGRLDVELSGPTLRQAAVSGSGNIALDDVNQDNLDIQIRGSGSAIAHGRVSSVHLEIAGSGTASLEGLAAKEVRVSIAGSGDADIAPTDSAEVSISGSGDVRLHGSPRQVTSKVSGSGHVIVVEPSPSR